MAVVTKEDLIAAVKDFSGGEMSDTSIKLMEDITDTFGDYESRIGEDWKSKYETATNEWQTKYGDLDKSWRDRYTARFSGAITTPEDMIESNREDLIQESQRLTIDDLFTERKG